MRKLVLFFLAVIYVSQMQAVDFDPDAQTELFHQHKWVSGGAGLGYEDDATLLSVSVGGDFQFDYIGFGFLVPVRFILDNPNHMPTYGGVLPKEDWDEVRDYVRLVTRFQYGYIPDQWYAYFGELDNYYLGNGSIVGAYFDTLRYEHPERGVRAHYFSNYAGITFFMDDVSPPNILGGRAYLKPFSFLGLESYMNNLELGLSWVSDIFAPEEVTVTVASGRQVNTVADSVMGADIGMQVLSLPWYTLKPYFDYNWMLFGGTGAHIGIKNHFDIPVGIDFQIFSRLEFRVYERNYTPTYFNSFYDVFKEYMSQSPSALTKYRYYARDTMKGGPWQTGYYADIVLDIVNTFSIGGSFEWNEMYDPDTLENRGVIDVNLFMNLRLFKMFRLDFLFTRHDAAHGPFLSIVNYNTLFFSGASFMFSDGMSIQAGVSKQWQLNQTGYNSILLYGANFSTGFSW